ncbi:MAG: hypothetical protein IPO83_18970 [Chitinophagaceae bacterium]|nr:hypothetical protein [Chitinophagaceae bacterium]
MLAFAFKSEIMAEIDIYMRLISWKRDEMGIGEVRLKFDSILFCIIFMIALILFYLNNQNDLRSIMAV